MDRIDLHVEVPAVRYRDLSDSRGGEPSSAIRQRVTRAREIQRTRFDGRANLHANADMAPRDLREFCRIGEGSDALLRTAISRLGLSARAYHCVIKIARTIADLDGGGDITTAHISEAIQYRSLQALPQFRVEPTEQARALALLAHATAGAKDFRLYEQSWGQAWDIIGHTRGRAAAFSDQTLVHLSHAATLLADRRRLKQLSTRIGAGLESRVEESARQLSTLEIQSHGPRP